MPDDANTKVQEAVEPFLARLAAEMEACEALGDDALARHTGRKLLAVAACAADELLRDGGETLRAAPDKVGAFFDRAAAGYVAAIEGLHKRAVLTDLAAGEFAPGGARVADPRWDYAVWGPPEVS
jgi:hypothetical protein